MIEINLTPYKYEMIVSGVEEGTAIRFNAFYTEDVNDFNIYFNITIAGTPRMVILIPSSLFISWVESPTALSTYHNTELGESIHLLKEGNNTTKIITEWDEEGKASINISKIDMYSIYKRVKFDIKNKEEVYWNCYSYSAKVKKVFNLPRILLSSLINSLK
jgi:hypothetical protein